MTFAQVGRTGVLVEAPSLRCVGGGYRVLTFVLRSSAAEGIWTLNACRRLHRVAFEV
jgi:hypothetical protein